MARRKENIVKLTLEHIGKRVRHNSRDGDAIEGILTEIGGNVVYIEDEQHQTRTYWNTRLDGSDIGDWEILEESVKAKRLELSDIGHYISYFNGLQEAGVLVGFFDPADMKKPLLASHALDEIVTVHGDGQGGNWYVYPTNKRTDIDALNGRLPTVDFKKFGCNEPYVRELVAALLKEIDK
jgi:hypothetical protein